jgi:hypothetical protein
VGDHHLREHRVGEWDMVLWSTPVDSSVVFEPVSELQPARKRAAATAVAEMAVNRAASAGRHQRYRRVRALAKPTAKTRTRRPTGH